MVEAWDEWTVDENWQGWHDACEKALEAIGDEVWQHRYIDVEIDYSKVEDIFQAVEIEGKVQSPQ